MTESTKITKIRVAMVGAGAMANSVHYPSLASFGDVEFAGICDSDAERRTATAERYRIEKRYDDYRRMIEETAPDAVYVIGQPHLMYDLWVWCLQQKLSLCIEKPMGITLHQARMLAHLAESNGCITQVSFQRRTAPMVAHLYGECRKRGPILHAVCEFYKRGPEPMLGARDRMMDDGVHAIDTLRWLCGGEIVGIDAVTRAVGTPDINLILALLRFDNGATGVLLNSWTSGRRVFRVQMHAPGICAEAEHEEKGALFADGDTKGQWFDTREFAGSDQLFVYGGFQAKNREFIDAVRNRTLPPSHFGDAVKTMEAAERILASGWLS
ncbi:MAG: Gfo/Idh/MocA family oxidoreductase [Capsulimonadales bacterium]|nr:Gfo/Idh/MocA family oxidoreductase [Capsulimonadales bacterium]